MNFLDVKKIINVFNETLYIYIMCLKYNYIYAL